MVVWRNVDMSSLFGDAVSHYVDSALYYEELFAGAAVINMVLVMNTCFPNPGME